MSVFNGPEIVNDGLVFAYDMSNTQKSWKGKPTTNYVITKVENYTGWSGAGWWMHPGNTTSVTSQDLPDGNIGLVLNATALSTGGLYGYNGYALSAAYVSGTQYTVSFWARSFNGTASISVRDADSGGALSSAVSGITNNWARFSFTWTANASSNMLTFTGTNFSLYNVQLEINSFATPFVVGTRSSTQAILDLTNNNSITTQSLTYASDNTFSFNGSSDYIDITNNLGSMANYTIMFWAKRDSENRMPVASRLNTAFYWYGDNSWKYNHGGTNAEYYYSKPTSIPLGSWGHYCVVYDGSYVKIYRQGVFQGQQATTGTADWSQGLTVGWWSSRAGYAWNGKIDSVSMYNRALTEEEVYTNFSAIRSRYGI